MEAIKHITPDYRKLNILLPEDMVHEELEVIILRVRDSKVPAQKGDYRSQKGKLSKIEAKKMLAHVEESPKEWQ